MVLTVAEVRRRLQPGVEFTGEFIGKQIFPGAVMISSRKVVKNSSGKLESLLLDGPKAGEIIHLPWKGIKAYEKDGAIFLSGQNGLDFLKITLGTVQCE